MRYVKYRSRLQQHPVMLYKTENSELHAVAIAQSREYNYRTRKTQLQSIWAHAVLIKLATDITDALFDNGFVTLQVDFISS